jgi:hypothetical protein
MQPRVPASGQGAAGEIQDFNCSEQEGMEAYSFSGRVKGRLENLGVARYERPVVANEHMNIIPGLRPGEAFDGRLPTVVRKLTLDQLSALYTLYTNWFGYLQYQTNLIAAERSEAKRKKEFLWSHIRKKYKNKDGKKLSDQASSDEARSDFRFVRADATYEELNVLYNCMNAMCEVASADMKMLSREVTIHQIYAENSAKTIGGRNMTWPGRSGNDVPSQGGANGQSGQHAPSPDNQRGGFYAPPVRPGRG